MFTIGTLITKILVVAEVDTMEESVDAIHININYSLLSSMMVHIFWGELRNKLMDEDEVVAQPVVDNSTFNTILDICQQIALSIHNLEKHMEIIKKNP